MAYKNRILPTGGEQGPPGEAATVSVGSTTTGAPGTNANVTQGGTPQARVFNFTIPRGAKGDKGDPGGVVDSDWVSLSLATGWTGAAHYRIIGGVVYLRGRVTRTSGSSTTILTLPASACPADALSLLIRAGSSSSPALNAGISTAGAVVVSGAYSSGTAAELESLPPFPLG